MFDGLSDLAPHEISHFIFFRQLSKIPNNLSVRGIHHLKEVLTPVLLQHPDILKHRHNSEVVGNKESTDYLVEIDGKVLSIFDFVKEKYFENPTPEGYMPFLHWLINIFEKIEPELLKLDKLFAENGRNIFSDPELKSVFLKPIKISKK